MLSILFLVLAALSFFCAAANMPVKINLQALGFAFLTMWLLVGAISSSHVKLSDDSAPSVVASARR